MNAYYARCTDDRRKCQSLAAHLRGVAELCRGFAVDAMPHDGRFATIASITGLLHDLGKYRSEFQQYLLARGLVQKSTETAHAMYGAAAACFKFNLQLSTFAIAGHHAGLHDLSDLRHLITGDKFQADRRYGELLRRAEQPHEFGPIGTIDPLPFDESDDEDKRRYELLTRMLFSMLVDADRLDSEKWEQEQRRHQPWNRCSKPLDASTLLQVLDAARRERAGRTSGGGLLQLRNDVFDACFTKGRESPQGFFTLTVPTGGGKTLASMAFALAHANRHRLRRVIVVIPYLSIIEQNARDYRRIFGADQVLEHHCAVDLPDTGRKKHAAHGDEPGAASDAERVMENWDAPIIVTTSVQFLETIFAATTARARKLHNIARSVVVFDEVQTLPVHLLEPTLDALRELNRTLGVSFLFCSASQPAFRRTASVRSGFATGELQEVAPDPPTSFRRLRRVRYTVQPPSERWSWEDLAQQIMHRPVELTGRNQALCVVNLRRQAVAAWKTMRGRLENDGRKDEAREALFHLSSAMCPAHRLDVLGLSQEVAPPRSIRGRLQNGHPCWVISTQLIEAGVDIDFPIVFRAMGPLDSIVQSGGRCNREGLLTDATGRAVLGEVVVFHPEDSGLPPGIYERATSITPTHLDAERLVTDPRLFADYFTEIYDLSPTDHSRRGERSIQECRAAFDFRTVAERAKVIRDDTTAVIVPYGRAKDLVRRIRKTGHFDRNTLRRLQRFMVSLRRGPHSDHQKLHALGALEPLLTNTLEIPVLAEWCYDLDLGIVIKNRPPEEFIA